MLLQPTHKTHLYCLVFSYIKNFIRNSKRVLYGTWSMLLIYIGAVIIIVTFEMGEI